MKGKIERLLSFGENDKEFLDENEKIELKAFNNLKKRLFFTTSILYFKPVIPFENRLIKPDILWVHPQVGILVIEVKAWDKDFIKNGEIKEDGKFYGKYSKYGCNPIKEAESFVEKINRKIQKEKSFIKQSLPISFIIYFPNLTEKEYETVNETFKDMIPKEFCLFKGESNLIEKMSFRLGNYNWINRNKIITEKEFEPIRKALFPYLSINKINLDVTEDDIPILDFYQENLLHSHKKGYRILRGSAGSGKTVVLIGKAIYEKIKNPDKKILMISFVNALVNDMKFSINNISKMRHLNISDKDFDIRTVDSLIFYLYSKYVHKSHSFNEKLDALIKEVQNNPNLIDESEKYDVILCDESQDFEKDIFKLIKILVKKNGIIVFGVDETQRIYKGRDWRWIDVGFDARGRVTILKRSYRNPGNILKTAIAFLQKDKKLIEELKELEASIVSEEIISVREDGEKVDFYFADNEFKKVKEIVKELLDEGNKPGNIFILTSVKELSEKYKEELESILPNQIHAFSSKSEKYQKYVPDDKLVIMPYKSSKGLEREIVIVTGVNMLPYSHSKKAYEKRLDRKTLYVALTRAQKKLIITAYKEEKFAKELKEILKN